jgi:hypothetical protein
MVGFRSAANGLALHHLLVKTFIPIPIESGGEWMPTCPFRGIEVSPQAAAEVFDLSLIPPGGIIGKSV